MKQKQTQKAPQEIFWPVGPDATWRGPIADPDGSYTGKPLCPWEMPVQDADDL